MSEEEVQTVKDDINSIKTNCALHKQEITNNISSIESSISNAFGENGIISQINAKLDQIDKRLFRTNGTRALVEEVRECQTEIKEHIKNHTEKKIEKKQYLSLIISVILASTVGTTLTMMTAKMFSFNKPVIEKIK